MSGELKGCPFCGSKNARSQIFGGTTFSICCDNCSTYGPLSDSERGAILAWSRRDPAAIVPDPEDDEQRAAVAFALASGEDSWRLNITPILIALRDMK